jgi:MvaI/BcnI restriction endonuclease family
MLSKADKNIKEVMAELATHGIEAAYIVPTITGLEKSILDAHEGLRNFFKRMNFHDYGSQQQGTENKILEKCFYITENEIIESKVSLYRPQTKSGDPRIWFYDLNKHASANNLLVLFIYQNNLYIVNASNSQVWKTLNITGSPLNEFLASLASRISSIETELLNKLVAIYKLGFHRSTTNADNGVGDTLENLLGIKRNSNRSPDYKGIELKATRLSNRTNTQLNRNNLFSRIPNWDLSTLKSGSEILNKYGYYPNETPNKKALHVTLNHKPNAQGLYLELNNDEYIIENLMRTSSAIEKVVVWKLGELELELEKKHNKTFWIKAETKLVDSHEQFLYKVVEATSNPMVTNFGTLVSTGSITLDYTFSEKERASGKIYARDHGYLWKVDPNDFALLFPPKRIFDLRIFAAA